MEQLMEFFLKKGLRPFQLDTLMEELEQKLTHSELTTLLFLDYYGELSMSELAQQLGAPLSTLTSMIHRLQKRKLIQREKDLKDRRIYLVKLTADGEGVTQTAKKKINHLFDRVQMALTPQELQQFMSLAVKVAKAIQNESDQPQRNKETKLRNIPIED
ncbi:MarR family winged helix-turn-helix transcriptional regulator [Melghirimyces algeriensis]|uniref:DNA-binding transcriptional regulator, MarR family n=1 Tax=Melghirimyces algeriensis TaxID=910412 RepID=A0A521CB85_9BACL|nr:MarR family transcriptional regulator [Melghirimyces algeriensis]SMO56658.1 DNA-binding transcriptional regulator, MarR family [Melghirimyces algeriensis]